MNVKRNLPRFSTCRVSVAAPYSPGFPPDDADWIFVDEQDFVAALRKLSMGEAQFDDEMEIAAGKHLSEYLRFMVGLAHKLELSPEKQPLKDYLIRTIGQ